MRKPSCGAALLLAGALALAGGCRSERSGAEKETMQADATSILDRYQADYARAWKEWTHTEWMAATTGKKEDFDAHARADLALKRLHSDPEKFRWIEGCLEGGDRLDPVTRRALHVADLEFRGNQLPEDILKKMADMGASIGRTFSTFRGEFEGKRRSNNELLEVLAEETDSARRKAAWEALKQVGAAVGPDLVALARIRNEGARKLGFENYWDMEIRLQEHDPDRLMATFAELEALTTEPFRKMKAELDAELARKFSITPEQMMPWHYDNPFFQAAPPSAAVDLDEFYRDKQKEDIVAIATRFYADIDLPIEEIVARSDLYEREGKDQHAFCEDMDRKGDVRTLLNIRPTVDWMDTMLHENGHAVYDEHLDRTLPFNLRSANHEFTTEGVAMLFGALAKNPSWLVAYAGADPKRVEEVNEAIREQRRREQLIFCRWTLVMLHFEKALYENPDNPELNELWWDYVERFQMVNRPAGRDRPDWAAKPHFTIAPVYYHNYQLGELFAAQLRHCLAKLAGHRGPTGTLSFNGRKEFGAFLREKVFRPGKLQPWPAFVERATGEPLTARYFAEEL
jgi:peptidyl-dipeptidase A